MRSSELNSPIKNNNDTMRNNGNDGNDNENEDEEDLSYIRKIIYSYL